MATTPKRKKLSEKGFLKGDVSRRFLTFFAKMVRSIPLSHLGNENARTCNQFRTTLIQVHWGSNLQQNWTIIFRFLSVKLRNVWVEGGGGRGCDLNDTKSPWGVGRKEKSESRASGERYGAPSSSSIFVL